MSLHTTWDEIVASTLRSNKTIREDLQDAIYNVTPAETPLLSRLQMVGVDNMYVQWLVDVYADAAANAQLEGIAFTDLDLTVPTRAANITQIFYKGGKVSDRQRAVEHAGFDDPFVYYEGKHVVEIKRDMELAIVKGSAATGDTDTANQMNGFLNFLSTNNTDQSGVTLTEKIFNDVLELVWGNTAMFPNEVYVGPQLKRTISIYSTKVTPFVQAAERRQILTTSMYESDFGTLSVNLHRDLASAAAGANEMLVIDPNWFATGWLQPLRREILARDGKRDRYQISAELTVLFRNEKAGACVTNCRPYIT
jgi:hypothetical protein